MYLSCSYFNLYMSNQNQVSEALPNDGDDGSDDNYQSLSGETDEELTSASSEIEGASDSKKCGHYDCKCAIIAPCCEKMYPCRLCHNSAEEHEVDRFSIETIVCQDCDTHQVPAESCVNCHVKFGNYVCLKCRLFDFVDKKQWHCEGCGICRVGGKENFFHCDKCGFCLANSLLEQHRCIQGATRNRCAVCWGNLHESRVPLSVSKCGHPLHRSCFKQLIKHKSYSCPTCKHSMVEMNWENTDRVMSELISESDIPESELRDVEIFCNDCHNKSKVRDYLLGLFKCSECGSYNTQK